MWKTPLAVLLSLLLVVLPVPRLRAAQASGDSSDDLMEWVERPYLEILERASRLHFSEQQFKRTHDRLKDQEKAEKKRLKSQEKALKKQIKTQRKELERLNKQASRDSAEMAEKRRELHCSILKLEEELRIQETARKEGLPLTFENKRAKLELLREWPEQERQIQDAIESGEARMRRWGNVEDIGVRIIEQGQEKDVKLGQDAVRELKAYGMIPDSLEEEAVVSYVEDIAHQVGRHSDLKVPLHVVLLDSDEINAFALPGGYLYINRGLLERTETESELVGVIAHEIAHVTARHGNRLMKKATIAGIIFQAAQIAALIFTGGTVGLGTYYALQYGFFGLGMALSLTLLGVSRDYELEADQLGVQYAWNAGYDPKGFITFFDKMATEKGYVKSTSFFRTHPPFFKRIVMTFSEIEYLPPKAELRVDSQRFREVKAQLARLMEERDQQQEADPRRPSLRRMPPCSDPPPASP
ncbi:MAG TPA: M48 family metalloprotease [Acidobacteriota bacterium]|nr:M48 family metalloprotease [Acidobacteriota bacterium]